MNDSKKIEVRPSAQNKGLIYSAQDAADAEKKTKAHLDIMADYEKRGHLVSTEGAGLSLVGPSNPDANGVVARAHNASMAAIEEKLAELVARIAALEAKK